MRLIDSPPLGGGPQITMDQIEASGKRYASNPAALRSFIVGIQANIDLLQDQGMTSSVGARGSDMFFDHFMHNIIPKFYSPAQLESLGGSFAIRVSNGKDYTVSLINRRVLTLKGLPFDLDGRRIEDTSIRADALLGLINHLLSNLASRVIRDTRS